MASENIYNPSFYRRTASAVLTLTLLAASPAVAQVIIGGDGTGGVTTASPHSQPPAWLMQYAAPAAKKKTKAETPKLKTKKKKTVVKVTDVLTAPGQPTAAKQKPNKALMETPWSPRAQVASQTDLFPELTKQKEEALMVVPQLSGAKPSNTRAETTLPAVLTPNLMDSMVQVAREEQGAVPVAAEQKPSTILAATATASGEQYLDEGAYSPSKAGTADRFVLGKGTPSTAPVALETKKAPRKLFSSATEDNDNQQDSKKTSGKLLADIDREPVPTPQSKSQEPFLPATPPPTPVPQTLGTIARRDDDLTIPDKAPSIDSLQPLDDIDDMDTDTPSPVASVLPVPAPSEGRRLIASLSDTKPDVKATTNLVKQPTLEAPKAAAVDDEIKVSVDDPAVSVTEEVKEEVKAVAAASAVTEEIDITQMVSAPRRLGTSSEKVANAAPTPRAAPVAKVEIAEPEVTVEVPSEPPAVTATKEPQSLLTIDKPEEEAPAVATLQPQHVLKAPEPIVAKPPVVETKKAAPQPIQKKVAEIVKPKPEPELQVVVEAPEVKVEVPPVAPVEEKSAIVSTEEIIVAVPDNAPDVIDVPVKPVDAMEPLAPAATAAPAPSGVLRAPEGMAPIPLARIEPEAPTPMPTPFVRPTVAEQPAAPEQKIIASPDAAPVMAAPQGESSPAFTGAGARQTITPSPYAEAAGDKGVNPTLRSLGVEGPPNLRVETPANTAGTPRLRTPRLVPDVPLASVGAGSEIPRDVAVVPMPLAAIEPSAIDTVDAETPHNNGKQTIYFPPDTKDLDEASKQQIDNLVDELEENPMARVTLTAYADADLVVEARRMALARALAIRTRMAKAGIQPARVDVKAVGQKSANDNGVADRVDVVIKQ